MRYIPIVLLVTLLSMVKVHAQSADAQAVQVAYKIAKKMKDSLDLTGNQRNELYQVNMQLHNQKQYVRQLSLPPDSVSARMQRIERSRDTLYQPILGEQKYLLYRQKKRNLVSNN